MLDEEEEKVNLRSLRTKERKFGYKSEKGFFPFLHFVPGFVVVVVVVTSGEIF